MYVYIFSIRKKYVELHYQGRNTGDGQYYLGKLFIEWCTYIYTYNTYIHTYVTYVRAYSYGNLQA